MCLDFLKSLRERPGAAPSLGMSTFAAAFPALGSQSRGVGKATPTGVLPPSEKKKTRTALPLCHCKHCDIFWREGEVILCMCELEF